MAGSQNMTGCRNRVGPEQRAFWISKIAAIEEEL